MIINHRRRGLVSHQTQVLDGFLTSKANWYCIHSSFYRFTEARWCPIVDCYLLLGKMEILVVYSTWGMFDGVKLQPVSWFPILQIQTGIFVNSEHQGGRYMAEFLTQKWSDEAGRGKGDSNHVNLPSQFISYSCGVNVIKQISLPSLPFFFFFSLSHKVLP